MRLTHSQGRGGKGGAGTLSSVISPVDRTKYSLTQSHTPLQGSMAHTLQHIFTISFAAFSLVNISRRAGIIDYRGDIHEIHVQTMLIHGAWLVPGGVLMKPGTRERSFFRASLKTRKPVFSFHLPLIHPETPRRPRKNISCKHPGVLDIRGRSAFSRFDPRPERPHFSNFGPPADRSEVLFLWSERKTFL